MKEYNDWLDEYNKWMDKWLNRSIDEYLGQRTGTMVKMDEIKLEMMKWTDWIYKWFKYKWIEEWKS